MAASSSAGEETLRLGEFFSRRSRSRKEVVGAKSESAVFIPSATSREEELERVQMQGKNLKTLGCREATRTLKRVVSTPSVQGCEGPESSTMAAKDLLQRVTGLMSEIGNIKSTLEIARGGNQEGAYAERSYRGLGMQSEAEAPRKSISTPRKSTSTSERCPTPLSHLAVGNQARGESEANLTRKLLERVVFISQISCEATVTHTNLLERLVSEMAEMRSNLEAKQHHGDELLMEMQRTNKLLAFGLLNSKPMMPLLNFPDILAENVQKGAELRDLILQCI